MPRQRNLHDAKQVHKAAMAAFGLSLTSVVTAQPAMAAFGVSLTSDDTAEPMNVLFICIDDLRPAEISSYGNKDVKTPNIDRLAGKGIQFNRAYIQYPICNPSRASFLTGKRPDEVGIYDNQIALREKWPDVVTLPQLFRNHGYFTAGLDKILHIGLDENGEHTHWRDDQSYDFQFNALDNRPSIGRQGESRMLGNGRIPWAFWRAAKGGDEAQPDGMIAAEAVRLLNEERDPPFFIGVGFHKPHDPFVAPKEYFEYYSPDEVQLAQEPEDRTPLHRHALPNPGYFTEHAEFTERDHREFKWAYYACVTFVDAQVGKLFEVMDRRDLWDNTIVVLMSDHGYHLGERDWWNKNTIFELSARTPLILWVPGMDSMGQKTDAIVEFVDLYPTLADLCGLEVPHEVAGQSFRPVLEDPGGSWENVAYTQVRRGGVEMGYSVRTDRWRLMQWGAAGQGGYELYDHSRDQGEYYDLADDPAYREVRNQLVSLLEEGFPVVENARREMVHNGSF